jgi:transcription-repair coupling factor (superfamily II helicase)
MEMYKRISVIESVEDADDVTDELIDRFGDMPKAVERLVNVSLVRALAERARIKKVESKDMRLCFISDKPDLAVWSELFARFAGLSFLGVGSPVVVYRMRKGDDPAEMARRILSSYVAIAKND